MSSGNKAFYSKRLNQLEERTGKLKKSIKRSSRREAAERISREYDTCRSYLEQLKWYAEQHGIEGAHYEFKLNAIEFQLNQAQGLLRKKLEPWWRQVLKVVNKALSVLGIILRIVGLINRALPFFGMPKLLPGGD